MFAVCLLTPEWLLWWLRGRGSCSPVWFLPALHQLCRCKDQGPAILHSTSNHPEQWAGCARATQAITFMQGEIKVCQRQTSMMSVWNRKVKIFFQSNSVSTAGGGGRNIYFFRCSPEEAVKRKQRLRRQRMKGHWNEEVNAGECFWHALMWNFITSTTSREKVMLPIEW